MRIIAIGLGGAGSRIVDRLYAADRRNSKVACVQGLAIDVDEATLRELKGLPESAKIFFPALDLAIPGPSESPDRTATIDINEIISKVQNLESGENDAIFICCGLGGTMAEIAPHLIARLRSSVVEPIFGLVTLPCLAEGERKSGKAADDIEMLEHLLDGIILFDNETWYKKVKPEAMRLVVRKEVGLAEKMGLKKAEAPLSPVQATYLLLNEAIVRRISLILRAGEFKADGGIDLAEVVLDSGEVLNTMKGMGFIAIGYAVEKLVTDPFSFLSKIKPAGMASDEHQKKASRIVDLAKQAIYHEISTPCDMTSAHKALVLVAGPTHEISMKGFMTVRKWIDRSIAGLETRSGDYPVMNTKNVAIIIMLSGLENIPRITEIKEIRDQLQSKHKGGTAIQVSPPVSEIMGLKKDEMIVIPSRSPMAEEPRSRHPAQQALMHDGSQPASPEREPSQSRNHLPKEKPLHSPAATRSTRELSGASAESQPSQRRNVMITARSEEPTRPSSNPPQTQSLAKSEGSQERVPVLPRQGLSPRGEKTKSHGTDEASRIKESERQRIEKELQRQRMAVISGRRAVTDQDRTHLQVPSRKIMVTPEKVLKESSDKELHPPQESDTPKTVVVAKRKTISIQPDGSGAEVIKRRIRSQTEENE